MTRHRATHLFVVGFAGMMAAGWIGFPHTRYRSTPQPLDFNHRVHKDKAAQKCGDCHTVTADGAFTGTPNLASCAGCHAEPMGATTNEKVLVAAFVKPGREIPWRSYSQQPMNVRFSHAVHINLAKLACEKCHGNHGEDTKIAQQQENRISGYTRGAASLSMSACEDCHRQRGVDAGCLGCHK